MWRDNSHYEPVGNKHRYPMPPSVALILWFILLLVLLCFDPAKAPKTSGALWVPVVWMFIIGSRLPSQWLGGAVGQAAQALEEGNPLDRAIYFILILLASCVLKSRSFSWGDFFARNVALMAFISFALLSVCWSDFPFVAFKRWFRDLGSYLVVLVVLSDPRPLEAVRTVLRRLSYLLVPLSIVLIKYFPEISKQYDSWTGVATYAGATTSKNMLGAACLVSGLFFFWDMLTRWPQRKQQRTKRIILVNVALLGMTLWLLHLANSATSGVCLLLGCLIVAATHSKALQRRLGILKGLIPISFCLYVVLAFGFNLNGDLAGAVGRDPTLTDRTKIWQILLRMHTNPLIGTGYQSFWLGSRLQWFWQNSGLGQINEAHNGYLQVYLNLGLIGVLLLAGFLIAGYRNICSRLRTESGLTVLALSVWAVLVFYNMTEAAFEGGVLWLMLLMGVVVLPQRSTTRVRNAPAFCSAETLTQPFLEATGVRTDSALRTLGNFPPSAMREVRNS
jgi:exopolysaccharide production protein ExoQ